MTLQQSGKGGIEIFEDFCGPEWILAETVSDDAFTGGVLGGFRVIGLGVETDDSGILINESTPCLSGVARLTTTDEDVHSVGLTTALAFNVALMAPIVLECRVQVSALTSKQMFFGLSDVNTDMAVLEGGIVNIATSTVVSWSASDVCGFLFSAEATHKDWHAVYRGGDTAHTVLSTEIDLEVDPAVGEWQVLRLEVDPDGTARWLVDGVLLKTLEGAVSTTTNLAAQFILEAQTTTTQTADLDYIMVRAARDWTV